MNNKQKPQKPNPARHKSQILPTFEKVAHVENIVVQNC